MAAQFKKGDSVRIVHPLDGVVDKVKFDEDTGEPRYTVTWKDGDVEHHRVFAESELTKLA